MAKKQNDQIAGFWRAYNGIRLAKGDSYKPSNLFADAANWKGVRAETAKTDCGKFQKASDRKRADYALPDYVKEYLAHLNTSGQVYDHPHAVGRHSGGRREQPVFRRTGKPVAMRTV